MSGLDGHLVITKPNGFLVDIELDIAPGTVLAMVGPNGAGKTTVVSALAGLNPLEAGHINLNGVTLDNPGDGAFVPPSDRQIGVVFQDGLLFPHLDVRANIGFGLTARDSGRDQIEGSVDRWLDRLGLRGLAGRLPRELSGGEAQRVALARALVLEPDMLILDEPMGSLDVSSRSQVRSLIKSFLYEFEQPALVISHDPLEAFMLGDEIAIIEEGSITQRGSVDDIRMHPATKYAADVAGTNLVAGTASGDTVTVGSHTLHIPATDTEGRVVVSFHPRTVALHIGQPEGSPRNVWHTTIDRIDDLDSIVRVRTGGPLPVIAEVTKGAAETLALVPGMAIWVSVKATELVVTEAD